MRLTDSMRRTIVGLQVCEGFCDENRPRLTKFLLQLPPTSLTDDSVILLIDASTRTGATLARNFIDRWGSDLDRSRVGSGTAVIVAHIPERQWILGELIDIYAPAAEALLEMPEMPLVVVVDLAMTTPIGHVTN